MKQEQKSIINFTEDNKMYDNIQQLLIKKNTFMVLFSVLI